MREMRQCQENVVIFLNGAVVNDTANVRSLTLTVIDV